MDAQISKLPWLEQVAAAPSLKHSNTHTPNHTSHTLSLTHPLTNSLSLLSSHTHSLSLLKNLTHTICLSQTYTNTHQYADIEDSMTHADFCLLFTHPQTHTLIHIPTHTHPHPYTHTCPYTNTHTCSHTHSNTQLPSLFSSFLLFVSSGLTAEWEES